MKKIINKIILVVLFLTTIIACKKQDNQPPIYDITGTWYNYAYLCSDGYFVDISDTGHDTYFIFSKSNTFTEYLVFNGKTEIRNEGTWTYDPYLQYVEIKEPRGWDFTISIEFENDNQATFMIYGHLITSRTLKVRRQDFTPEP